MKKGITTLSVAIMVLIIVLLTGTITTLSYSSIQNADKIVFALEISSIQETVDKYVRDSPESEYPVLENKYVIDLSDVSSTSISQFEQETKNANNEITVYEVDLNTLNIKDNTYGNKKNEEDVYVISIYTGTVYYLEGIKAKNITYYTLTEDLLDLKEKKDSQDQQESTEPPVISTDGFVTKELSNGGEEIYLNNIKVKGTIKIFKYEEGIILEEDAKEYFEYNGRTVIGDRLSFTKETDVTLYAENYDGEYDVLHCIYSIADE